jgi:hypothetical protein
MEIVEDMTPDPQPVEVVSKKKKVEKKKEYDEDGICKICMENPIDTVMVECGHQVICYTCSPLVGSICPLCRQPIIRVMKTYHT